MKTVLAFFLLTTSGLAMAQNDLNCSNDQGESLSISHSFLRLNPPSRNIVFSAEVFLLTKGLSEVFKGTFDQSFNAYELFNQEGDEVELRVVKPTPRTGRCGRCSPAPFPPIDQEIYAKLTFNQTEIDFSCKITN
ncbi:MAG: hypothetical protein HOP07_10450 [Bacteriovoracaceae bacterium]|nr:hypothetical protein [Bacteriovoracaceae bacterium]